MSTKRKEMKKNYSEKIKTLNKQSELSVMITENPVL